MDLNIEELLEAPFKKEVQPNITQSIKPMLIENESMQSTPKVEEDSPIEKQDLRERITHSRKSSYRSRSRERTRRSSRERETGRRRSSRERERKRYRSRSPRRRSRSRERSFIF
jgi:RNA-binding protein 39